MSTHRTTSTLSIANPQFGPAYYVAGVNEATGSHLLKVAVYNSTGDVPMSVSFAGVSSGTTAALTVLTAPDGYSHNDIGTDVVKKTVTTVTASSAGVFSFSLPDLSISVLEVGGSGTTSNNGTQASTIRVKGRVVV